SGTYDNLAAFQCRYDWCVVFEHFESTRRTGYGHGRDVAFKNGLVWGNDGKSHVNCGYTASANSFLPFSIASSMVPTKLKAASGYSSTSPSMIMLNPLMVSLRSTNTPLRPVNCSATWKGWDRKRCTRRARATTNLSSSDSSSIPRIAMISCSSL